MALINCPECGKEISDKADKCIHCGYELKKKGKIINKIKNANKKIPIIIGGSATIIIAICVLFFILLNSNPVKKYVYLFNNDKSKEAMVIYDDKIDGNVELEKELSSTQNVEMDNIYKQFKSKELSYTDAEKQIVNYTKYAPSKKYGTEIKQKIDSLDGSRTAYADAQDAEKSGDIENALKKYKAVIDQDDSYADAQDKIESLKETFKTELLNEAESYVQNNKYKEAIADVDKVISVLGSSDDLTELKQKYSTLKAEQYAKIIVTDKSVTPKDSKNWIFKNYVNFVFEVTNNSDKAIKGIEGTVTVSDLFGKEMLSTKCDFTGNIIQPNETYTESDLAYACNEFFGDDMKMYNTDYSDLQFSYDITSIVYEDGTTVMPE